MKAERARILEMLHQGAITVEQAEGLLEALERSYKAEASPAKSQAEVTLASPVGPNWAELGTTIAQRIQQGLSGAFGALRGAGGAGRTNFSSARLTNESLSRMSEGTGYTNFGSLIIADDVEPELLSGRIGGFTNFGSVTGPANLLSILESACDTNFGSFGGQEHHEDEDEWEGPEQSNMGKTVLTKEQLEHMADGTKFSNLGRLTIAADVPPELVKQKIARYENLGKTYGPASLIGVLQALCPENMGRFAPDGTPDADD